MGHLPTKGLVSVTPWPYLRTTPPTRSSQNIPSETAWKIEHGRSMTYAPEHGKVLCDRPHRRRRGCIEPHLPPPKAKAGEEDPKTHATREILDAIFFYVLKSGCPWRLLPRDFPLRGKPSSLVVRQRWRVDGTFERLNAALCERLRARLGRNPLPRVCSSKPCRPQREGPLPQGRLRLLLQSARRGLSRLKHLWLEAG
jgi:transposase